MCVSVSLNTENYKNIFSHKQINRNVNKQSRFLIFVIIINLSILYIVLTETFSRNVKGGGYTSFQMRDFYNVSPIILYNFIEKEMIFLIFNFNEVANFLEIFNFYFFQHFPQQKNCVHSAYQLLI